MKGYRLACEQSVFLCRTAQINLHPSPFISINTIDLDPLNDQWWSITRVLKQHLSNQ